LGICLFYGFAFGRQGESFILGTSSLLWRYFYPRIFSRLCSFFFGPKRNTKEIDQVDLCNRIAYHFFLLTFSWCVIYSIYIMLKRYNKVSGYKRNQIKYILLASIVGFGGGATNYPLIYDIPMFPFGHYLLFLYPIIISYAIITMHLMDITVAVTRTAIFTTVYSIFLGIPPLLLILQRPFLYRHFGAYWWLIPAGVAVCELLAFVAPSINHYFQERANRVLLKKQRIYQQNLIDLAKQMTLTKDLRGLLVLIIRNVTREIGISHARIYLLDRKTDEYVREVHYGKERRRQYGDSLYKGSPLVRILSRNRDTRPYLREVSAILRPVSLNIWKKLKRN